MSVDDMFQFGIRSAAALVWIGRLLQLVGERDVTDYSRRLVSTMCLALVLSVVALGGLLASLHVVPGGWIATAYTGTAVIMLMAGVTVWR